MTTPTCTCTCTCMCTCMCMCMCMCMNTPCARTPRLGKVSGYSAPVSAADPAAPSAQHSQTQETQRCRTKHHPLWIPSALLQIPPRPPPTDLAIGSSWAASLAVDVDRRNSRGWESMTQLPRRQVANERRQWDVGWGPGWGWDGGKAGCQWGSDGDGTCDGDAHRIRTLRIGFRTVGSAGAGSFVPGSRAA